MKKYAMTWGPVSKSWREHGLHKLAVGPQNTCRFSNLPYIVELAVNVIKRHDITMSFVF